MNESQKLERLWSPWRMAYIGKATGSSRAGRKAAA